MDDEAFLLVALLARRHRNRRQKRRWVHPINAQRERLGEYALLVRELASHEDMFFSYFRMSESLFDEIFSLVEADLTKLLTNYRKPISARERLAVCLRLALHGIILLSLYIHLIVEWFSVAINRKNV